MNTCFAYIVKDKDDNYYCGYSKWDKQLRKALQYVEIEYAYDALKKYKSRNPYIMVVKTEELFQVEEEKAINDFN